MSISALIQGTIHVAILMSTNCHWIVGGLPHRGSQWLSSLEDKLHASVVAHTWERLAVSKMTALFSDPTADITSISGYFPELAGMMLLEKLQC